MKNNKLTVSVVITFVLSLWEFIAPTAEVIFGIGTKGMMIASFIVTVLSFAYNYFYPKESLFRTIVKHIGTRPKNPPKN